MNILVFQNGNIAVCDASGQQVPELQVSWPELFARHAESLGYNPEGWVIEQQAGPKMRFFRTEVGGWNRDIISDIAATNNRGTR